MVSTIHVGTVLIGDDLPHIAGVLMLDSEPYCGNWRVVRDFDGFALDKKIHAAGWNFLFLADEVKGMFFGSVGAQKVQNAMKRILDKVRCQNFNCLEVTGIVAKRFLGVPYVTVFAHSRHIQQGYRLQDNDQRRAARQGAEWAHG